MYITNKGNKAISFGKLTLLPDESKPLPNEFVGNPTIDFLKRRGLVAISYEYDEVLLARADSAAKEADEKAKAEAAAAADAEQKAKAEAAATKEAEKKAKAAEKAKAKAAAKEADEKAKTEAAAAAINEGAAQDSGE